MASPRNENENQRLGDFEIVREIGRGGMGVVYEARQVSLNRKVALKVLSGGLGLTPKAVQRFRREAEAAAKLHHTNIVPVYATGEHDGTHFYAMELIDGPSLDHVIRQLKASRERQRPEDASAVRGSPDPAPGATAGLPEPPGDLRSGDAAGSGDPRRAQSRSPHLEATGPYVGESSTAQALSSSSLSSGTHYFDTVARLIADVADALEHAHQNGVIHRDIKPSNLLLSSAGRLSVNDFGLARMLEQPGMTMTGEFVGTPAYMSPEQIAVGRISLDHRTDIYSLGATLYELLTLGPPFRGQSREQVLAQIVQKEPRAPRRIDKRVPVDLETICLKCLEKDPDRRYQTAGALAEDLRRYVNRFAILARRAGPVERLRKWVRRRPAVACAIAVVVLAFATVSFFAYRAYVAEQELRAEKLQNALEKALAAAMGGDLDKAEKAISEAEVLGASTARVRMLRGMVAYYRGDIERALVDLKQAVELDPDSAAARGMLAVAYLNIGDWHRYGQIRDELESLAPRTTEDYLFKGYAQHMGDIDQALQNLDEAVRRSSSPLVRAVRADGRVLYAQDGAFLKQGELAVVDVQQAKEYLPDNPFVLSVSVQAQLVVANLYLEAGNLERRKAALNEADSDARGLKRWDTLPHPFGSLWAYFEQTGDEPASFDLARRAAEKSDAPVIVSTYALALYRRSQFKDALEVLDRRKWKEMTGDYLRAYLLAELHPQESSRAREAYEEMTKRYTSESDVFQLTQILRLLGYKDKAVAVCRALRQQRPGWPNLRDDWWTRPRVDYYCGDISEKEFLNAHDSSRISRCDSHYMIALTRLAEGDRDGAREHFRQAVQTRLIMCGQYDWIRCFLARMEKDDTWPPWIGPKKDEKKP